jgi:hypothetical protein
MAILRRDRADCERLQALHAKSAGFPFPPRELRHQQTGRGFTLYLDPVVTESDGRVSYDMPTDTELGPSRLSRLTGPERAEIASIRAKPEPTAARKE